MLSKVEQEQLRRIVASVSASYTRRELDRRVYDQLMASSFGQSLKNLNNTNKYALEFVTYLVSAVVAERVGQPGPLGEYLKQVLTDAPSEIARRMINGVAPQQFNDNDIAQIVNALSPADFENLAASSGTGPGGPGRSTAPAEDGKPRSDVASVLGEAAAYVESLRSRVRRKDRKP